MKSGVLQSQATVKMAYRKIYEEEKKKPDFYGKLKVKKELNIKKKKDARTTLKVAEHHLQCLSKERPLSCFIKEEKILNKYL